MPIYEYDDGSGRILEIDAPNQDKADLAFHATINTEAPKKVAAEIKNGGGGIGQYTLETAANIPGSALGVAKDIYQTVRHPIQTAENLGSLAKGISQKLGLSSGTDSVKYADAVWDYFKNRYGSVEGIKKAFHDDPVAVATDAASLLSGGGAILKGGAKLAEVAGAARTANVLGATGKVAAKAGDIVNPINVAGQAIKLGGKAVAGTAGSLLTGTGGKSITESAMSGAKAITEPAQGRDFRANFFNKVDQGSVVNQARDAISDLIKQRGQEYVSELKTVAGKSSLPLPYDKIDAAIDTQINKFHGQVLDESLQGVVNEVKQRVDYWKGLPNVFQTPLGFDALKKNIADIRNLPGNTDQFGRLTKQGVVVKNIEQAIVKTISDADPKYAKIMHAYSSASDIIDNLQRELSLGRNANVDTGLRKLQSVLRNNVNTSYGRRERLAQFLADNGATTLLASLAGQQMSSIIPRGLAARAFAAAAAFMGMESGEILKHLGIATLSSPKLVGGAAHLGGLAASPLYAAAQAGRRIGLGPSRAGLLARGLGANQ